MSVFRMVASFLVRCMDSERRFRVVTACTVAKLARMGITRTHAHRPRIGVPSERQYARTEAKPTNT
jgi:hypothetical protein